MEALFWGGRSSTFAAQCLIRPTLVALALALSPAEEQESSPGEYVPGLPGAPFPSTFSHPDKSALDPGQNAFQGGRPDSWEEREGVGRGLLSFPATAVARGAPPPLPSRSSPELKEEMSKSQFQIPAEIFERLRLARKLVL